MEVVATMVKRVGMQEFQRYTSKWLKKLPIYVTYKGLDEIYICKASELGDAKVATEDNVATSKVATKVIGQLEDIVRGKETVWVNKYGCGCEKVDGRKVCKKHGRV